MNRTIIDVPTDEHGNGCLVLDGGTNSQPGITSSPTAIMSPAIVSVDKWGSNPVANGYWPGDVGWQDHAGHPLLTVTGAQAKSQFAVAITTA